MRKILNWLGSVLKGQYTALIVSLVSLLLSYVGYRQSVEAVRPKPQLTDKEVIVCHDDFLGFNSTFIWVRLVAMNQGGKATTLLYVEPDTAHTGHWIVAVDSVDKGYQIDNSYRLYYHDNRIRNFRSLSCAADSLVALDKNDKIELNVLIEPGAAYPFDLGMQRFVDSNMDISYYQVNIVGVFSDGSRIPLTTSFKW